MLAFMLSIIIVLAVFPSLYRLIFVILVYFCFLYGACRLFKKFFPIRRSFTICVAVSIITFYVFSAVTSIGNEPLLYENCTPGDHYCNLAASLINGKMGMIEIPQVVTTVDAWYLKRWKMAAPKLIPQGVATIKAWWDLSAYDNKLYMYWGITPALTFFIPVKLLTGYNLHPSLCIALFISIGYIFSLFVLALLIEKSHLQSIPDLYWYLSVVCLGLCTFFPYILQNPLVHPIVYEVPIAAGFCFSMGSLCLLLKANYSTDNKDRHPLVLFLSGLFCALAVGCRPHFIIITLFALLYFVYHLKRSDWNPRSIISGATAYCIPYVSYGAFLGIYNYIRFNSFFEFGLHYQINHLKMQELGFNLSDILAGVTSYFFTPLVYTSSFPYFSLTNKNIFNLVHMYQVNDHVVGIFWGIPVILILVMLPLFLRNQTNCRFIRMLAILMTIIAISILLIASIVGPTVRYECDFAVFLLIPSLLVFFDLQNRFEGIKQHILSIIACALIIYSITLNFCISFAGDDNLLQELHPQLYNFFQGLL